MVDNPLIITDQDRLYFNEILNLRSEHKQSFGTILKGRKYKYLLNWLESKTPLLNDKKYTVITKLYWVSHGFVDFPVCSFCHKEKLINNIDSFEKGYFRACSTKCEGMKESKRKKIEQTCLKNWGATNFFGSKAGKAVKENWCREHGVENPFQLESVKEKSCQSRKEHFGYEYTMQSAEKRKLASDNYKDKTGYNHQFENPEIIAKSKHTKQEKKDLGIDDYAKTRITNRKARYVDFCGNEEIRPVFSEEDFIKLDAKTQYTTLLRWKCLKCGTEFDAYIDQNFSSRNGIPVRCEKCHPFMRDGSSGVERALASFINDECNMSISENDRSAVSPYELDIYIQSKSLAFEFDGLFWHSEEAGKDRNYHLMKTDMCEKKNIQLVHIFEDEWLDKQEIVKSRIKDMFGQYSQIVYARKCTVADVDSVTTRNFLDENHLQGGVNGSVRLGLYFNGELVSLMTFGKCRFDKRHEWEMLRFCNKLGYHVIGGAGKLLKHFEKTYYPKSLVTYADRRWSQGKLYKVLNFNFIGNSVPGYFYIRGNKRYSRITFQKHKLQNVLEKFDPEKTEVENMKNNGYYRIFDCGNMVFEKIYPENVM